jgi:hypothetical protein
MAAGWPPPATASIPAGDEAHATPGHGDSTRRAAAARSRRGPPPTTSPGLVLLPLARRGHLATARRPVAHRRPLASIHAGDEARATPGHGDSTRCAAAARSHSDRHRPPAPAWYCCRCRSAATWSRVRAVTRRRPAATAGAGMHGNLVTARRPPAHRRPLASIPAGDEAHATPGHGGSTRCAAAARSRRDCHRPPTISPGLALLPLARLGHLLTRQGDHPAAAGRYCWRWHTRQPEDGMAAGWPPPATGIDSCRRRGACYSRPRRQHQARSSSSLIAPRPPPTTSPRLVLMPLARLGHSVTSGDRLVAAGRYFGYRHTRQPGDSTAAGCPPPTTGIDPCRRRGACHSRPRR